MSEEIKKSMQKLQAEAQSLLLQSGYHRSLVRFHTNEADHFDSQVDVIAKRIRNLENNMPKEKVNEPIEETKSGTIEQPREMGSSES